MNDKALFVLIIFVITTFIVGMMAGILAERTAKPSPVTTVQFDCLIVDSDGVSVHAILEVEKDDVIVLITGKKWRFQPRMEER